MRTLVVTSFFLFLGIGVVTSLSLPLLHFYVTTSIRCRDLISVVSFFASWSQLLFSCCDIIQLSLAFKQVATQLCWSAYFLVATWSSGRDQVVSLISAILVATSKVCRNLIVLPFTKIYVATSIPCRDIIFVAIYIDLC